MGDALQKPKSAIIAILLLWANLAVLTVGDIITMIGYGKPLNPQSQNLINAVHHSEMAAVAFSIVMTGLIAFLTYKISCGSKWPRIIFIIWIIGGIHGAITEPYAESLTGVIGKILIFCGILLLFTKSSQEWFAKVNVKTD